MKKLLIWLKIDIFSKFLLHRVVFEPGNIFKMDENVFGSPEGRDRATPSFGEKWIISLKVDIFS